MTFCVLLSHILIMALEQPLRRDSTSIFGLKGLIFDTSYFHLTVEHQCTTLNTILTW